MKKRIMILGATGSLAQYVLSAIEKNPELEITLVSRRINTLGQSHTCIQCDLCDYQQTENVVKEQDIVYINLAGDLDTMSKNIIQAMQKNGIKRVIAISSIGIYNEPLSPILRPYRQLADRIEASGLEYTIIRPDWFSSENEVNYHITQKPDPEIGGAVSRKSIADFIAKIIENPEMYKNTNVGISKV